jgi:hypothetical protein
MSLDEKHRRLYVGCRTPAQLLVFDTDSLKQIASLPINGDIDDIFFDQARTCLYLSCGEGLIDIVSVDQSGQYIVADKFPTSAGARTSLFVPELNQVFLAAPTRRTQPAEIHVYTVQTK